MKQRHGFTLIELLLVIAIIGILMAILIPTVTKVKEKAKRTQAKADARAIETAVKSYEATYGFLPFVAANFTYPEGEIGDAAYTALITWLQDDNPRQMRFLDVDTAQGPGTFNDPWENRYRVAFDLDYDGDITDTTNGPYTAVYASVAVWSWSTDEAEAWGAYDMDPPSGPDMDDINSWE